MNNKRVVSIIERFDMLRLKMIPFQIIIKKTTQKCWRVNTNNRPALKFQTLHIVILNPYTIFKYSNIPNI